MLNVNVPYIQKNKIKGFRVTRQGRSRFIDTFEKRVDPRGESYFWIKGEIGIMIILLNLMGKQFQMGTLVSHQ